MSAAYMDRLRLQPQWPDALAVLMQVMALDPKGSWPLARMFQGLCEVADNADELRGLLAILAGDDNRARNLWARLCAQSRMEQTIEDTQAAGLQLEMSLPRKLWQRMEAGELLRTFELTAYERPAAPDASAAAQGGAAQQQGGAA